MNTVTWFVLDDGSTADPSEVKADDAGVLRHKDGRAVKMRSTDCPLTRSVDVSALPKAAAKQMQPQSSGVGYLTRDGAGAAQQTLPVESAKPELDGDLAALRAEYQKAFGKHPFHGWDAAQLREKIAGRVD